MKCKVCNQTAIKDGYCKVHLIQSNISSFLDNSDEDISKWGIFIYAKYFFPHYFRNEFGTHHHSIMKEAISLYNPDLPNVFLRQIALIAFRGSAKSTILNFLIPSYMITLNGQTMKFRDTQGNIREVVISERFIVIASKTGDMASEFVQRIRDELSTNKKLKYYFSSDIEDAVDNEMGQWTKKAFKYNNCFILGIGAKMQARGRIKGAWRPTLFIFDDIYDDESVKTPEQRASIRTWFNASASNTIDIEVGKTLLGGTILHEDTVIQDVKSDPQWRIFEYPIMDYYEFKRLLSEELKYDDYNRKLYLKYEEIEDIVERSLLQKQYYNSLDYKVTWSRYDLYSIILLFQKAVYSRTVNAFFQEYFNKLTSDNAIRFREELFRYDYLMYEFHNGVSYIKDKDNTSNSEMILGVDLSGGQSGSDDASVAIIGISSLKRIYIIDIISGRFSIESDETRKGIVQVLEENAAIYNCKKINIGYSGSEVAIVDHISQHFRNKKLYDIIVNPINQHAREGDKRTRIKNILLPYFESRAVTINYSCKNIQDQLVNIEKTKDDNEADALSNAFRDIYYPGMIPYTTEKQIYVNNSKSQLFIKEISKRMKYNETNNIWINK